MVLAIRIATMAVSSADQEADGRAGEAKAGASHCSSATTRVPPTMKAALSTLTAAMTRAR